MGMSDIQRRSFEEAQRLGHDWVGPEHWLLAILRGDADDVARRALEEAGLDAAMVEAQLERMRTKDREPREGVRPNPAWHQVLGRAQAFAACLGTGEIESVHILLGLMWDDHRWQFAEERVPRASVVEALRRAGVALPQAPPAELQRPIPISPEGLPTHCQFCGGHIREGQRFTVPAKDRSWVAFFCSPYCASGFGVCALVAGGIRARGDDEPPLAEEYGAEGVWYEGGRPPS